MADAKTQNINCTPPTPRIQLYDWLSSNRADKETLADLCFRLNIDEEMLTGDVKPALSRALIRYCERQGNFSDLYELVRKRYPDALTPR
jgi:Effector-associated domain 7